LKGHDYSQPGAYFVTLVTQGRACLFGEIAGQAMRLNRAGSIVKAEWLRLPEHFEGLRLDAFVVMPNHVHGVVVIGDGGVNGIAGATGKTNDGGALPDLFTDGDGGVNGIAGATRLNLTGKTNDGVTLPDLFTDGDGGVNGIAGATRLNLTGKTNDGVALPDLFTDGDGGVNGIAGAGRMGRGRDRWGRLLGNSNRG
jgi:hypothetical protein